MTDDKKTKTGTVEEPKTAPITALDRLREKTGALDAPRAARLERMVKRLEKGGHLGGGELSMVLTFDTTGSMNAYFAALEEGVEELTRDIYSFAPGTRIAFVAYKDHEPSNAYVTRPSRFFENARDLKAFMDDPSIQPGQGGEGAEALECALYDAWQMLKDEGSRTKVIVNIGDKPAHGVMDSFETCTAGRDYRLIVREISAGNGHIYTVTCGNLSETVAHYTEIAAQTNGVRLDLDNITDLTAQLTAIAGASTGKLAAVEALLKTKSGGALSAGDRKLLEAVNPTYGKK